VETPEFQIAPETLCCLLTSGQHLRDCLQREQFSPIQQAHYGARELAFGGRVYRPDAAGYNDVTDINRLSAYLSRQDPTTWTVADLRMLGDTENDAELTEELDFVRDWFPALTAMYRRAKAARQVVVCEVI